MRKIVDDEIASDEPTPMPFEDAADTPDENSELVFGATESPMTNPEDLSPSPTHIVRLWQIYLDRCNPLTKIIHVPTLQPYVLEATGESPQLPKNVEALFFSIYLLATIAMSKEECEETLGMTRDKAMARFGQGVRTTLARMDFLKSHDLLTLQALVIYLVRPTAHTTRPATIPLTRGRSLFKDGTTAMHPGF